VKNNFSVVILAILVISVVPMGIEYIRHRLGKRRSTAELESKSWPEN
jgi:hypothetical protein